MSDSTFDSKRDREIAAVRPDVRAEPEGPVGELLAQVRDVSVLEELRNRAIGIVARALSS